MVERNYQPKLIAKLKAMFPGCIILKNDEGYIQGIPDLTLLWKEHWAFLETKRAQRASHRPNQDYYINAADSMSFGRFINPDNEEEVLHDLQQAFTS